jgi:hypothetical protein
VHELAWKAYRKDGGSQFSTPSQSGSALASRELQVDAPGGLWVRWALLAFVTISGTTALWTWFIFPLHDSAANIRWLHQNAEETKGQLYVYAEKLPEYSMETAVQAPMPRYTVTFRQSPLPYYDILPGLPHGLRTLCDFRKLRQLFAGSAAASLVQHPDGKHKAKVVEVDIRFAKNDPSVFSIKQCQRDSVPLSYWISAYAIIITGVLFVLILAYGVIHFYLLHTLAALAGLTNAQYGPLEATCPFGSKETYGCLILAVGIAFFVAFTTSMIITLGG